MPAAARPVAQGRLRLSRAPTAELAAAAIRAQRAAGLEDGCDFVVVAVTSGTAAEVRLGIEAAAGELVKRIAEHRAGEHPYGSMRRDCPLCAQGRA